MHGLLGLRGILSGILQESNTCLKIRINTSTVRMWMNEWLELSKKWLYNKSGQGHSLNADTAWWIRMNKNAMEANTSRWKVIRNEPPLYQGWGCLEVVAGLLLTFGQHPKLILLWSATNQIPSSFLIKKWSFGPGSPWTVSTHGGGIWIYVTSRQRTVMENDSTCGPD
jgi:hypothetical protein